MTGALITVVVLAISPILTEVDGFVEANEYDLLEGTTKWTPQRTFHGATIEGWRPLVAGHFDGPEEIDRALCLMGHESGGDPTARNTSSGAAGLMQVMPSWADVYGVSYDDLFNPSINLFIAADLQDRYGWTQWSPYKRGLCR